MNPADNFAFHAAHPSGGEGYVLLLFRPDAEGTVHWREWSSTDVSRSGREGTSTVDEVIARAEAWHRAGWTMTEHPRRIAHFLRG